MNFILNIVLVLLSYLCLSSSLLHADTITRDWLEEIMKDTWKIQLENLNEKEISSSNTMIRMFWNETEDEVDINYFDKFEENFLGKIKIHLKKESPEDNLEANIEGNEVGSFSDSVVVNGVKFNFISNEIEVFLGDLTIDDIKSIEDRLRLAVVSNEILNPWLRIANSDENNPEEGYYLSKPQQEVIDFLLQIYRDKEHKLKNGALIQLPTGMGKTRAIFSFIKQIEKDKNPNQQFLAGNRNYRVLWFVSGIDVLRQTRKDFNNHFSKDSMFGLYGKTNTKKNQQRLNTYNDLSVSLDTLIKDIRKHKKNDQNDNDENEKIERKDNIDLIERWINSSDTPVIIVVDEAHKSNAQRYLEVINQIRNDCSSKIEGLIGMTATPYRSDLDLPEIYGSWYMWEISDDKQRKIKTAYDQLLSAARQGYIPIPYFISLNKPSLLKEQPNTEKNKDSSEANDNKKEKEKEKNVYDEGKLTSEFLPILKTILEHNNKVLIYHGKGVDSKGTSTSRQVSFMEFLKNNHKEIVDEMHLQGIYSINSLNRTDENGNDLLDTFKKSTRAILNLTGVGDYGTDIPDVDCIIFLDASKSMVKITQRVGRATRLSHTKPVTTIIDWGNGRILSNLKKKIFFNASPEEIKEDLIDTVETIQDVNSSLTIIEQLLKSSDKEFIIEILSTNSSNFEKVSTTPLTKLIELCNKIEKKLNEKKELNPEEKTLQELIEKIIVQNQNSINKQDLKELQNILKNRSISTRYELIEVFNWYIGKSKTIDNDLVRQIIVEIIISWAKEHDRFPYKLDFGIDSEDQVGITYSIIKRFFGNEENDSEIDVLKENMLDQNIEIEVKLMILSSTLGDYWYQNKVRREKLQNIFIRFALIPFMNTYNRFPSDADIREKLGNMSRGKIFGYGTNQTIGIFDSTDDCFIKLLDYIDEFFPENSAERAMYLEAIYTSDHLAKIKDENILKRCRENIKEKIENGAQLQGDYLFSNLYEGTEGKKFREYLQNYIIKEILTFIKNNNGKFPSYEDLNDLKIGNITSKKIFGDTVVLGIFGDSEDCFIKLFDYIDEFFPENSAEREYYLEVLYTAFDFLKKMTDKNILKRCRKNIKEKIENGAQLQGDYLFPNLYKEDEDKVDDSITDEDVVNDGKKFREYLQNYVIQNIITFIENNNGKFPTRNNFKALKIGNINYKKTFGNTDVIGIFDDPSDLEIQFLKCITSNPQINLTQKELYLKSLFKSTFLKGSFTNKVPKVTQKEFVDMILNSEELTKMFIECRNQKYLNQITRFVNTLNSTNQENTNSIQKIHCPTIFSTEQNP